MLMANVPVTSKASQGKVRHDAPAGAPIRTGAVGGCICMSGLWQSVDSLGSECEGMPETDA